MNPDRDEGIKVGRVGMMKNHAHGVIVLGDHPSIDTHVVGVDLGVGQPVVGRSSHAPFSAAIVAGRGHKPIITIPVVAAVSAFPSVDSEHGTGGWKF